MSIYFEHHQKNERKSGKKNKSPHPDNYKKYIKTSPNSLFLK